MLKRQDSEQDPVVRAAYKESYWWLIANDPELAEGLEYNIKNGSTPYEEYRKYLTLTQRHEKAMRVKLAALHLVSEA